MSRAESNAPASPRTASCASPIPSRDTARRRCGSTASRSPRRGGSQAGIGVRGERDPCGRARGADGSEQLGQVLPQERLAPAEVHGAQRRRELAEVVAGRAGRGRRDFHTLHIEQCALQRWVTATTASAGPVGGVGDDGLRLAMGCSQSKGPGSLESTRRGLGVPRVPGRPLQ